MKKSNRRAVVFVVGCLLLACGGAGAWAQGPAKYVPPTEAQILAIAEDPALLAKFIKDASEEQTADLLLVVIDRLNDMENISLAEKQKRVGQMFDVVREVKGSAAAAIIARVLKKANPRLLPIIRRAGATSPAPPYRGQ